MIVSILFQWEIHDKTVFSRWWRTLQINFLIISQKKRKSILLEEEGMIMESGTQDYQEIFYPTEINVKDKFLVHSSTG